MDGASLTIIEASLAIIGTVLAVGFALAGLMIRTTARLDRRIDSDKAAADADRRAFQAGMDAFRAEMRMYERDMRMFERDMRMFEREMRRLAERRSHVEGQLDERGSAAD